MQRAVQGKAAGALAGGTRPRCLGASRPPHDAIRLGVPRPVIWARSQEPVQVPGASTSSSSSSSQDRAKSVTPVVVEPEAGTASPAAELAAPLQRPPSPSFDPDQTIQPAKDPAAAHDEGTASPSPEPAPREPSSHPLTLTTDEDAKGDFFGADELVEELKTGIGSRGEGWFFAQLGAFALIAICPFKLVGLIDALGTLCLATGIVFVTYSLLSLGRSLSPMPVPRRRHKLVTSGMYAYARHPMYGGVLLLSLGIACLTHSETRLALTVLLWWILDRKARVEEESLEQRYPGEYSAYQGRVSKFIPYLY